MTADNGKDKDDTVRYNFKCRRQLREDAKRNAERGELAERGRQMLQEVAYGVSGEEDSRLKTKKAELENVRDRIDDLRGERRRIDAEIESQESRATRLEEQISQLESQKDELEQTLETLENMLRSGERMWPVRVKNAADVEKPKAKELYHRLKERNEDLPAAAFEEPRVHTPSDWREEAEGYETGTVY